MIKQYMCNNFLAEQILKEVVPSQFQHRIGLAEPTSERN